MVGLYKIVTVLVGIATVAIAFSGTEDTKETIETRDKSPEVGRNTYISLINATPYNWTKTYNHSYQMNSWDSKWPKLMQPGESVTVYASIRFSPYHPMRDSAGETTYRIEGTKNPMSFQVQCRSGIVHEAYIQFLENLETLNNNKYTEHNLGFSRTPGGVGFVLAGTEDHFISNDGPLDWMQSQINEIGHLPLREITLPRSHHSGQWKNEKLVGGAQPANTQAHVLPLYDQLGNGGIRVLDIRPMLKGGVFHHGHVSVWNGMPNGMLGATIKEMVDMQNKFMKDYPGELFIWDIHEHDARNGDKHFKSLDDEDRKKLYKELFRLQHRHALPDGVDISTRPLNTLISERLRKRGRSCVIVRLPTSWATKKYFPGSKEGFLSGVNFPYKTRWSNTNKMKTLVEDQLRGLREARPSRSSQMYNMDWILTQQRSQALFPLDLESIIELSGEAWKTLFQDLWNALTDETYPNWIALDNIHGNQHKALAMAINKCLAARNCGSLGGKVKVGGGE
ncbi:LysM domain-containing protein [Pochonia chlamydosporia 170]|uniref:LysM domain-containing protein n=1 Tax=Pochonia chlamydosporia 170 TaxID=1380566 RepID=A0A179F9S0_METCM|nr:LysM domain-containing protein [Pochonia chlamydosporia 170]OAQ62080.1 LysM domain-containing protein [Pochonia chlamydosporia 170]